MGRISGVVEQRVTERRSGLVSISGLVLVAWAAYSLWSLRSVFFALFLMVGIPLLLLAMVFPAWRSPTQMLTGGMGRAASGAARGAAQLSGGAVNAGGRQRSWLVEERSFRVIDATGATHECALRGYLVGGSLRVGDDVTVVGRRTRHGVLLVRWVRVTATGATIRGRVPLGAQAAKARSVVLCIGAAIALLATLSALLA